jgi:TIR domain
VPTPKVFLSHSSSDKQEVRPLAERLRHSGIDVWFDEWEMGPGDSLVQKIDEGLTTCDVFLIVISAASVASKWVREELSTAVVRRIEEHTKLIAIRLDETPVPAVINHLLYVPFHPLDESIPKVLKAIFNVSEKPPIGTVPDFVHEAIERKQAALPGLSPTASVVLRHLVHEVQVQEYPFQTYVQFLDLGLRLGLEETEFADALDELEERGLITPLREVPRSHLRVKPRALIYLARELGFDLKRAMQTVAQAVVGNQTIDGPTLERETGLPLQQLRLAVAILEERQLMGVYAGGIGAGWPYGFVQLTATRKTREWVKMQQQ